MKCEEKYYYKQLKIKLGNNEHANYNFIFRNFYAQQTMKHHKANRGDI